MNLKKARLSILDQYPHFEFIYLDLVDRHHVMDLFDTQSISRVINLAAQVGVRYSLEAPLDYVDSNVTGFTVILEACRRYQIQHLVYASSSSVYGAKQHPLLSEKDSVDHPLVIYAATKRYNELAAHSYSNLYDLPTTGLRFFSVYGPWGRPDMAIFKFTHNIMQRKPIDLYNYGNMSRDFTYVDDIVHAITLILDKPPLVSDLRFAEQNKKNSPHVSDAPFNIFNIGRGKAIPLMDYVHAIERNLDEKAIVNLLPLQDGETISTCADITLLHEYIGYRPSTNVEDGVRHFVDWYRTYFAELENQDFLDR